MNISLIHNYAGFSERPRRPIIRIEIESIVYENISAIFVCGFFFCSVCRAPRRKTAEDVIENKFIQQNLAPYACLWLYIMYIIMAVNDLYQMLNDFIFRIVECYFYIVRLMAIWWKVPHWMMMEIATFVENSPTINSKSFHIIGEKY